MLIIDIGANNGLFTDKCLELYGNNLKIVLVEANPNLYNFLTDKYKYNENIIVLNNLMSEKDNEDIDFYICDADGISTASIDWVEKSRFSNDYRWHSPIKIKSKSIDSLIGEYGEPNLIKVDVEGYELQVLKGLTKKSNEICFEWAEEQYDNINKIIEHLMSLGYFEFGYILGDEYMKRPYEYGDWKNSKFHEDIDLNRKEKWGMIWTK